MKGPHGLTPDLFSELHVIIHHWLEFNWRIEEMKQIRDSDRNHQYLPPVIKTVKPNVLKSTGMHGSLDRNIWEIIIVWWNNVVM